MKEDKHGKKMISYINDEVFIQTIFSWSLEDILNEQFYCNKVKRIPDSFESVEHYFSSFKYPLLEETRAQLRSSLEFISTSPFSELISFQECESKSKSSSSKLYDVQVHGWENTQNERSKSPYKILPGDVFVLADAKPQNSSDLERVGWSWSFVTVAKLTKNDGDNNEVLTGFKVKALKDLEFFTNTKRSLFLIFLTNITTSKRIWNALNRVENPQMVNKALCTNSVVGEESSTSSTHIDFLYDSDSFESSLLSQLSESQLNAIGSCLHKINCKHKSSMQLIWGPPGTGKTKTVSMLLVLLSQRKRRTLVCAPTNVAVVEVATRVVRLMREVEKGRQSDSFLCPLGDILLFGNNERLKVGSDVKDIYLDHRVENLAECCGPLAGWRHCFATMLNFLEDCVSEYGIFVENERILKRKQRNGSEDVYDCSINGSEIDDGVCKSFLEFVREKFELIAKPLRNCLSTFCLHLSKEFISESNIRKMETLLRLLDSFQSLLFQDAVVSEVLEEKFSNPILVEGDSKSSIENAMRSDCFSVLKALQSSLNDLKLPSCINKENLKKFCFEKASLIFCTASSSHQLHALDLKPLEILVIDEAAQLKECESCIPLQLPGTKHAILIGDECQLPAMVKSRISSEAEFSRSLFERLSSLGHSKHLLNIQYRMHPAISFFPNREFYNNMILDGPNVSTKNYEKRYLSGSMFGPYSFINVNGGREESEAVGHSRKNMVEVAIVLKLVKSLYKEWTASQEKLSIGVISPYTAQVVAIREKLGKKYETIDGFAVKVKSVDGFQGGEEDIIIISTVRSNNGSSIGFLSNPQRINVALTRARHCLWILGSERMLATSESVWEDLVRDSKNRHCFFDADRNEDLAKVILEVKKELDLLDDLLSGNSILFQKARWKILFSDKFLKSFKKLSSKQTKMSVLNLLMKLSNGWRPKRRIQDSNYSNSSQILQQFKVEGLYVLCAVDIMKETIYTQVMKIWDILPLESIPKLFKQLDSIFGSYSDDYMNCCRERCIEGNLEVPRTWTASKEIARFKICSDNESVTNFSGAASDGRRYVENSKVSDSLLLMKFYSLSFGVVSHLLSNRDGVELDLPFEVTDQELEIILHPRSTFVLGRSGTGKTTVLTMKLFQKEKLHLMAKEVLHGIKGHEIFIESEVEESFSSTKDTILRQLFVTVSPKLCHAIKKHVLNLKRYLCGSKDAAGTSQLNLGEIDEIDDHFKDVPDSFANLPAKSYPLVISFHKFLMMLDRTLGSSYFYRFDDARKLLCESSNHSRSVAMQTFVKTREVNYERFSSSYWPHFNSQKTKLVSCSRAFIEIISHIKGHLTSTEAGTGKLLREDYVALSDSRPSSLSKSMRENIYDIYQSYERMKMENGEYDLADFVIDLHHRLQDQCYGGDRMDFIYIDEVQDLTMSQIALFRYLCSNVEEGFIFSGDTAQTIARGIDFRFQDIKTLFYSKFVLGSEMDKRNVKGQISEIFQLSQNFRTHAGILSLSHSIIELLYRFFPHSIDVLKPETSHINGESPVLLKSGDSENAIIKIFGNNCNSVQNVVEFGAEQVILVRDESARNEILNYVGEQALVLTILECKGLEFQDVLLYNFFGSSPMKNQWRVVYNFMEEQGMLENCTTKFPCFKESKHNIMCSELKQLYVAVTRTRQRLWFCENNDEHLEPMFDYWKRKCLVQVCQLNDSLVQTMLVASTQEEWKAQGIKLYNEHNYEMAARCFEKAGDTYWERRTRASGLKARADSIRSANPEQADVILREAAEIFYDIGKMDSAAQCYFELRDFEKAGTIFLEKLGKSELYKAGECFALAGCFERAADVYARGNFFFECLGVCSKGNLFEIGLQYIHYWKVQDYGLEQVEQEFLESCALHYHKCGDHRSMMKFIDAFHSIDLMRNLLKSIDCLDELLLLEEKTGNFLEAAYIAKKKGDIIRQAYLLAKAEKFDDASMLILQFVLANSLWSSGSKGWPLKKFTEKEELLEKAKAFAKNVSTDFCEYVCLEADILSSEEKKLIIMKEWVAFFRRYKSIDGEMLAIRKLIDFHLGCNASKYIWEDTFISDTIRHLDETISSGKISMETMIYFWECWRDITVKILECLGELTTHGVDEYGEFCLSFLGVSRESYNQSDTYFLLNADADWVRDVGGKSIEKNSKLVSINVCYLVSSARNYWRSEMLDLGLRVLKTLNTLYHLSTKNSLSLFLQGLSLTHIFRVSKFLLETKHLDRSHCTNKTLQSFVELATQQFFNCVFPLDSRMSLDENMIWLRGTGIAVELLEQNIMRNTSTMNRPTHGKIGRAAMMILGSSKLSTQPFASIGKWLVNESQSWKLFFEDLRRIVQGNIRLDISLAWSFHQALNETFSANWVNEKDYITPFCFLYLLERILIMASSFKGYFFTTKSCFVEWLTIYPGYFKQGYTNLHGDAHISLKSITQFLVSVCRHCLVNKEQMTTWLRNSGINVNEYYPVLVLRFFVIVCLLEVNFGVTGRLLYDLMGMNYITHYLPAEFYSSLRRRGSGDGLNNFAEAFWKIGNPMVIVECGGKCPNFMCREAIFVDVMAVPRQEDALRILFPKISDIVPPEPEKKLSNSGGGDGRNLVSNVEAGSLKEEEDIVKDVSTALNFSEEKIGSSMVDMGSEAPPPSESSNSVKPVAGAATDSTRQDDEEGGANSKKKKKGKKNNKSKGGWKKK